ncbi:MAG: hypothetical protein RLZZ241_2462 [Bacteroidota bacterium]|jgi:phosphoribosyl-ATP pyrophosphohydrolase/phosphoribosyl-AMP cyclohydrolase
MMNIDFSKENGLIPAVVQDVNSRMVLMLGYMNEEAIATTQSLGKVTFYSRSKKRLWTKGESSGNFLEFVSMDLDCDRDSLLIMARPSGPVCHLGTQTCWGNQEDQGIHFLAQLQGIIRNRHLESKSKDTASESYVVSLFQKGIPKIAQKVGEEAVETVIEAMSNKDHLLLNESADLVFHLMVLLEARGFGLSDIAQVLQERHQKGR